MAVCSGDIYRSPSTCHCVLMLPRPGVGLVGMREGLYVAGYPLQRENRENDPKKIPVRENTGNLEILPKHREFGFPTL